MDATVTIPDKSGKGAATRERILEAAEKQVFDKGFSGTSINDIVGAAGLTKGAFFHHFPDKAALARAILERWADADYQVFKTFAERAAQLADDPLQEAQMVFKLLEEWLAGFDVPIGGCLFASYTYERQQFGDDIQTFIADGLDKWVGLYVATFEKLLAARNPNIEGVTVRDMAEFAATVIEGGLVLARAYDDPSYLIRQSRQFRNYLTLLFAAPASAADTGN